MPLVRHYELKVIQFIAVLSEQKVGQRVVAGEHQGTKSLHSPKKKSSYDLECSSVPG